MHANKNEKIIKQEAFSDILENLNLLQYFTFTELSDILQLCRTTRLSKTILKAQKDSYFDLLKRG